MWPDVISSGQAVCITVKSGQCTKICLTLFTNVHRAHYIMCSNVHHAPLQNWSIHTRPSFARAVQVDHDHGGPIGPWWPQAPAAQDVKVDMKINHWTIHNNCT